MPSFPRSPLQSPSRHQPSSFPMTLHLSCLITPSFLFINITRQKNPHHFYVCFLFHGERELCGSSSSSSDCIPKGLQQSQRRGPWKEGFACLAPTSPPVWWHWAIQWSPLVCFLLASNWDVRIRKDSFCSVGALTRGHRLIRGDLGLNS